MAGVLDLSFSMTGSAAIGSSSFATPMRILPDRMSARPLYKGSRAFIVDVLPSVLTEKSACDFSRYVLYSLKAFSADRGESSKTTKSRMVLSFKRASPHNPFLKKEYPNMPRTIYVSVFGTISGILMISSTARGDESSGIFFAID